MARIVSVHSFRGGTGKSNTTANLAALLALAGLRVGVVDTDIQSPGIHVLFRLQEDQIKHTLNDYLWERCQIEDTAHDVTEHLGTGIPGKVFLIPSSLKAGEIARILDKGYDVGLLNNGFQDLVRKMQLDVLLIDTHPGLNEETLLSIAISQVLLIILRPDQQDYQGTGVTVSVANRLKVPRMLLIVNKAPQTFNADDIKARVEETYKCQVGAVLPHSDEMMTLAGEGVFVVNYPQHAITQKLRAIAARIMEA
ncbi:MAG: MinD/ParA family protein [Chloroflexi bacterium]|nr:MinD/ParA family protein [Chloroflexota bacterium]